MNKGTVMKDVVIAGYCRSAFTPSKKGGFVKVRPDELVAEVVKGLIKKTNVDPSKIEDLHLGCAFPEAEQGMNAAKLVAFMAGLPNSVAGATVNRFCGSSMQAIHSAAGAIQMGAGDAFICAGVESMTRVPMGGYNPMPHPELMAQNSGAYMSMGETAENVADKYSVSRQEQEEFAVKSQQKAVAAIQAGKLKDEIVPIHGVDADQCVRPDTNQDGLSGLKPAFKADGSVTAGTSSPLTDGAAAVLVTSREFAEANGLPILAKIKSIAVAGCDPKIMGIGPVAAAQKALERAGISAKDLDVIELNEAFASQSIACIKELGLNEDVINIDGGAIALGHPLGATGARITGKAAEILKREGKKYALATQCIGGGQGIATVLEAA